MTVLVTGAGGFLGGNLARALAFEGRRVRALVRQDVMPAALQGLDVEWILGDVRDAKAVDRAVQGCEVVFHTAAVIAVGRGRRDLSFEVNVTGSLNVARAVLKHGVSRMIYTSTADTVGSGTLDAPAHEAMPYDGAGRGLSYVDSKRAAETSLLALVPQGLPLVIVNPTVMLGGYDPKPSSGRYILAAARGLARWVPAGGSNFLDVRDAVRGHLLAAERGRIGERYILGGENRSYLSFYTLVCEVLGRPKPIGVLPPALALAGGLLGEWWSILTGKATEVSLAGARYVSMCHYVSTRKAERELGFTAGSIRPALEWAVAWLREQGRI